MIPKDQKNITTLKYVATFYGCHTTLDTCCCDVKISGKTLSLGSIKNKTVIVMFILNYVCIPYLSFYLLFEKK
jgi:hypothetical protein